MASIITLFSIFIVTCISAGHANKEFVNVQCKTENTGQFGQQSLVECVIKTTPEVSNPQIRVVAWRKEGVKDPLLVFNKGEFEQKEGYKLAEPSWDKKNMNVSLLITNTAVEHEGEYVCMVITNSGDSTGKTNLKVTAKYNKPTVSSIPEKIHQGTGGTLTCISDGGYPKGQLRWFVEDTTDWTKGSEMQAAQQNSGLFHLSSKLILLPGSTFSKYTCVVYNATGGKGDEDIFVQDPDPEERSGEVASVNPSKVVAPVVVIGSLIIGLLLLLLIIRRRSQKARRHSTTPLMGGHEGVPTCNVDVEEGKM